MRMLRLFRHIALYEGLSYLVLLLLAMPLKYLWDVPIAVTWVGAIHGGLFIAFGVLLLVTWRRQAQGIGYLALGMLAAVVPGGTFLFDRRLRRLEQSAAVSNGWVANADGQSPGASEPRCHTE